jgi:hypothetical protein
MSIVVTDKNTQEITVVNGERTETANPRRTVTFDAEDIPGLPETLPQSSLGRRKLNFRPERISITYRESCCGTAFRAQEDPLAFDDVVIGGPNIRKDGSTGEQWVSNSYFLLPKDLDADDPKRYVDFLVPDYVLDLVVRYDPRGVEYPFSAILKGSE